MTLQNNYSGQLVKKVKQQQCFRFKVIFHPKANLQTSYPK